VASVFGYLLGIPPLSLRWQGARPPRGGLCFFYPLPTTASIYVDAFNLYYGCLKGTPYRWLDLGKLCSLLLSNCTVNRIRYFTARVSARPSDPQQPVRQQAYLRALQTIPGLSIHFGHYLSHTIRMPLANPPASGPRTVEVLKTEEKGSDVNLATYLLLDAFRGEFDLGVVISGDSDLVEPIRVVRGELHKRVGVYSPGQSRALQQAADFYRPIRTGVLQASQFPSTLTDAHGTITKPAAW